jgi:hypothetical protein
MWLYRLAYLPDVFCHLSEQEPTGFPHCIIFSPRQTKAFKKLGFHYQKIKKCTSISLSTLESFISENEIQLNLELAANTKEKCENLIARLKQYFLENLT